jgi:hypothetical protein
MKKTIFSLTLLLSSSYLAGMHQWDLTPVIEEKLVATAAAPKSAVVKTMADCPLQEWRHSGPDSITLPLIKNPNCAELVGREELPKLHEQMNKVMAQVTNSRELFADAIHLCRRAVHKPIRPWQKGDPKKDLKSTITYQKGTQEKYAEDFVTYRALYDNNMIPSAVCGIETSKSTHLQCMKMLIEHQKNAVKQQMAAQLALNLFKLKELDEADDEVATELDAIVSNFKPSDFEEKK